MKTIKRTLVALLVLAASYQQAFAITVSGSTGTVGAILDSSGLASYINQQNSGNQSPLLLQDTINSIQATLITSINSTVSTEINKAFNTGVTDANNELSKYNSQSDLAQGFANATGYANHVATHQGYLNYDLFSITTGVMFGAQAPSLDPAYYSQIGDEIEKNGDVYAGVATGLSFVNIGLNVGRFLPFLENVYANVKFGAFSIEQDMESMGTVSFKTTNFGVGLNYRYMNSVGILAGLARWRGIAFGSGFYRNSMKISLTPELDPIEITTPPVTGTFSYSYTTLTGTIDYKMVGLVSIDPSATLQIDSTVYTIPFEVNTSVQLLWLLNLNIGLGVDLNFGKSDIIVIARSAANIQENIYSNDGNEFHIATVGTTSNYTLTVDGSTTNIKPSFVRPRLNLGLGINLGPVKLDIPIIFYFSDAGFATGITVGIVW